MLLVVAATDFEMAPLREKLGRVNKVFLSLTGMGPVETALKLTRTLASPGKNITGVVNFGVAGAFVDCGLDLLDICLAGKEVFGDFGICTEEKIMSFDEGGLPVKTEFSLETAWLIQAEKILAGENISYKKGTFVTVNCSSGTVERGNYLRDRHQAICENMEGASVARVCEEFALPCLEIRCISNFVVDRDTEKWRLDDACELLGHTVARVVSGLIASPSSLIKGC